MQVANTARRVERLDNIAATDLLQPANCSWDELDLSASAHKTLREISRRANRGKRVAALFSGPAGAGKTRAASLLAEELDRHVIHIRLSDLDLQSETSEEALRQVFELADPQRDVLLFDEADALFGTGNHPSAQLEQRFIAQMESYPGLAILATHHCRRIDPKLVRRLNFTVRV